MKTLFVLTIVFLPLFILFSCVQKPSAKGVVVYVGVQVPKVNTLGKFEPKISGYVEEIEAIYLTVRDLNGQTVYESSTTNKISPSFSFSLPSAGTYTFVVEGKRSDNTRVFTGQTTAEIRAGQTNTVSIVGELARGTIEFVFEIDNTVWERYNVQSAQLTFKKEREINWQIENLSFTTSNLTKTIQNLIPTMYDVKFSVSLVGKDQYVVPETWSGEIERKIVVEPDKTTKVKFKVLFDSELKVVVELLTIDLPYVEGVKKLEGLWDRSSNTLTLTWECDHPGATFKIYKQISNEDGNYYFEEIGTTQDKAYVINNFTLNEYNRIDGIAINTLLNERESGLVILDKNRFTRKITVDGNLSDWIGLIIDDGASDGSISGNEIYKAGLYFDKDKIYIAGDFTKNGYYNFLVLIDISAVTGAPDTNAGGDYNWNRSYKFESGDIDFVLETWGDDFDAWTGSSSGFTSVKTQITHEATTVENDHKVVEIAIPLSLFGITDISSLSIKAAFVLTGWVDNGAQLASDFLPNQGYETSDGSYTIIPVAIRNVLQYYSY